MLFARRDLKDALGRSLSQRFSDHIGRYITTSNDDQVNHPVPIDILACYALIGEIPNNSKTVESHSLIPTIQQIIGDYHNKTGRWLNQEQVAFGAVWHDTQQQAATLKEQFRHLNSSLSTLQHNGTATLLRLSLLAQALQVPQFSTSNTHSIPVKPSRCSRKLDLPLDETNMTDLEAIGREVRKDCEQALHKQGVNLENTQTCWRLKLRYEGCNRTLTLKCMPIEMLREIFESQHLQRYGTTDENRTVVIDELVIEIQVTDTNTPETSNNNFYVEQWLSQWQQFEHGQTAFWSKQDDLSIQKQFSWLFCPVLNDILAKLVMKQADSAIPDFFITNHQKDVDEVVI